jgi:hypothetical protein
MERKALIGVIFIIVAMVLLVAAFTAPWFRIESETKFLTTSFDSYADFHLDHLKIEYLGITTNLNYEDEGNPDSKTIQTFLTTRIIAIVGMIGCAIGLLGALLVTFEKIGSKMGALMIFIAIILILLAPLYLMFTLPSAFEEDFEGGPVFTYDSNRLATDFIGIEKEDFTETSWGPSAGWIFSIMAVVLCIGALVFVAISRVSTKSDTDITDYSFSATKYDKSFYPTAHKVDEGVEYEDIQYTEVTEETQPLIFKPIGPKPFDGRPARRFKCSQCESVVIVSIPKRPLKINCSKCGAAGIVE